MGGSISKRHNAFQWDPICRWRWRSVWVQLKPRNQSLSKWNVGHSIIRNFSKYSAYFQMVKFASSSKKNPQYTGMHCNCSQFTQVKRFYMFTFWYWNKGIASILQNTRFSLFTPCRSTGHCCILSPAIEPRITWLTPFSTGPRLSQHTSQSTYKGNQHWNEAGSSRSQNVCKGVFTPEHKGEDYHEMISKAIIIDIAFGAVYHHCYSSFYNKRKSGNEKILIKRPIWRFKIEEKLK